MTPDEKLHSHEQLCAERYATIHKRLDRIEVMLNKLVWGALAGFGAIVLTVIAQAI